MRSLAIAILAVCFLATTAEARTHRKHHHRHHHYVHKHHKAHKHVRHHRHVRLHRRVRRHNHRRVAHRGNVHSRSGAWASVNPAHVLKFQCIVNRIEAVGYRIRFMGGYRHTRIASRYGRGQWSKHAIGNAIDINQTGRNRCVGGCPRMPAAARACGLFDGSQWRHPDAGHFEVPGPNPSFTQVAGR